VVAISMSWGFSEVRNEGTYDQYFQTPAGHVGITFAAASGDSGASGGVEWPSSSADVLAVGGTTLFIDSAGNYQNEVAWSGSGGGASRFTAEPKSLRPNPAQAKGIGKLSAAQVSARRLGRPLSPSLTRGGRSKATEAWTDPARPYPRFMPYPRRTSTRLHRALTTLAVPILRPAVGRPSDRHWSTTSWPAISKCR
jgi:hypothetical protein